jgi:hypothetical protein
MAKMPGKVEMSRTRIEMKRRETGGDGAADHPYALDARGDR